jgi:hypothetical protein
MCSGGWRRLAKPRRPRIKQQNSSSFSRGKGSTRAANAGARVRPLFIIKLIGVSRGAITRDLRQYALSSVKSGTDGLLTPPRNSQELSRAIVQLLEHGALRQHFISRGLLKARDDAWPRIAQRIAEYYVQLLSTNRKGSISLSAQHSPTSIYTCSRPQPSISDGKSSTEATR